MSHKLAKEDFINEEEMKLVQGNTYLEEFLQREKEKNKNSFLGINSYSSLDVKKGQQRQKRSLRLSSKMQML